MMNNKIKNLSKKYDLSPRILHEYLELFEANQIPVADRPRKAKRASHIIMVSTHGYWSDPPPTGLPDTGGQTYYVLEVSKAWARQGKKVIIIARWFEPYPRVEQYGENVWLIRVRAGGDQFVRKEDIYPLVPEMAEAGTAIAALFGANGVVGHYADGMTGAMEISVRLDIPSIVIAHSLGIRKMITMEYDFRDPEAWLDTQYNFWIRESYELAALRGADWEIANTPREPEALKDYYGARFPHIVMQAGAGNEFFEVFDRKPGPVVLEHYGLESKKYLIFYGRFSEAKNIPATVDVLGEAKKAAPKLFENIKLVIVGGSRREPLEEEKIVEHDIQERMDKYNFTDSDIVRIYGHQDRPIMTALAYHSLAYIGMQVMEPFGMGVAEAMAAGAPVIISEAAGITKWLTPDENGIIVDPHNPRKTAKKIISIMKYPRKLKSIASNGRRLAKKEFSWDGIAKQIAEKLNR